MVSLSNHYGEFIYGECIEPFMVS